MSPAAVDFPSPFVSPPQMQSKPPTFTPQNPNPNPNSSNAGYGSNGGFACGMAPPSSQSAVSSRSKPRLLKRRRRLGFQRGKSSTVPAQHDSGLNSFRSVDENSSQVNNATGSITSNGKVNCEGFVFGAIANESSLISNLNPEKCSGLNSFRFVYEDSNHVKNDCSSNTSNGFRDSTGDVMDEKVNNAGFVFGANRSTSILNLNREKKQSSGTWGQTSNDGFGRFNDVGFVFGVEKSNSGSNSNSEHKESSEDMGKSGANEFGKSENVGTLFGDNKKSFILNWNLEKRQYSGSEGKSEAGELGQCDSVQLGSKPTTSTSSSNFKTREPSINVGIGCEGRRRMDKGKKAESRKLEDTGFVFGSKNGNLKPNSNFEEKESSGNVEKLAFDGRGKMNLDFGKVDDLGFVFGGNWSELRSNLNSVKTSENVGKSVPIDSQKIKSEAQEGKFDDTGFVFGACSRGSSSISDVQKRGPSQIAGNLGFEDCGKIEVEFQKEEANDVFIFGSSSKTNSCCSESTKLNVEMNKLNLENSGNYTGFANTYGDKLGSVGNSKSNFVANTTFASGTHTLSGLSYGMRKITIRNCEKMGCSNNTNDSNIDSSASSDHVFVFGSDKNSPDSHTGKLGTISRDQRKNENLQGPGNGGAVERTEGININAACLPNGNNLHARSGLGVLDEQKKLGVPSGSFGEEKQTTNVNNNRSDDCSVGISTPKPFAFPEGLGKSFDRPQDQLNGDPQLNVTSNKSLFSSSGLGFEAPSISRVESKDKFCFTSTPVGVGASVMDFRTLNRDTSCSFAVNLSPRLSKKFDFSGNSRSVRDKRRKNTRGKLKQDVQVQQQSRQNHVSKEDSQQNMESSQGYSPMDFSPYQDTNCASSPSNVTSSAFLKGEDLAAGSKGANISQGDQKCRETNEEVSYNHYERVVPDSSLEKVQPESSNSRSEQISINSGCGGVAEHSVTSNTKREESDCKRQSCLSSSAEDIGLREFTFSMSSTQSNFSATKCRIQKKYRMKVGHSPHSSTPSRKVAGACSSVQFPALDSSYLNPVPAQDKEVKFNSQRKGDSKAKGDENHDKQGSTAPILKTCQKWRIRGNQAYEKGSLSKAEEFYTKGINSVPHGDTSGSSIEPLVLCYSNRAAARMSLGRMREALGDCMMAAALDSTFHKVQIRAANCYLAMGEIEGALQSFSKCLESGGDVCLDRRNIIEAANGVQKAQKVAKCMNQCAELLRQRTCNAAISALEIISAVLSISSYSERLLEMKGVALLMLRRYEEVIQHCERTLVFAEKNFAMVAGDSNFVNADGHNYNNSSIRLWRWHLMSKSYFYLGRLEVALDFLEKQELMRSPEDRCGSNSQESSIPLAVTVRELLQQKISGNEAFQSGRHTEAVEHYTAAVSSSIESHPFAAICFCNRAAAHQAMGQIADAIADCSLAMALDGSYSKAVSRRATLHEKIRDYEQAASDLQILISLLEKQSEEKVRQSGTPDGPTGSIVRELTQARHRLYSMEEKGKKGISLDHYLILGIKQSDTASEIKKAYRKAALRHHPDKAGQFLARSESGDDGKVWEEITDKVHKDADRLFKMIGEAYAVLSDPTKRSKYDLQEELRNDQKEERNGSRCSRGSPDFYSSPSRSSANWQYRNWQYGNSSSQW